MGCFNGKKFKERQVTFLGDAEKGIPSSIDYITKLAKGMANVNQKNYVVYERTLITVGTFYDFEPQYMEREKITKLIRFDRNYKSGNVLQDNGDAKSKPAKSRKKKGKPTKAE